MKIAMKKFFVLLYCCFFTAFACPLYVKGILDPLIGYTIADVSNGTYYIQNSYNSKYIDIHGPSTAEGALIHVWSYHTELYENWEITKTTDGYYNIKSLYSYKYIGVDSQNIGINKDNIKQYSTLNDYTKWQIYVDDDENYVFKPKSWINLYQHLICPSNDELQLSSSIPSTAQWKLYKQENIYNGTYFIQNIDTRKYMDLCGPSTADGAIIHQWDLNANNSSSIDSWRKWEITKQSDLYYTIKNVYSGKYLGLDTSTLAIKQYSSIADNTKWKIYLTVTIDDLDDGGEDLEVLEYIFVPKGDSYPPYSYSFAVEDGTNINGRDLVLKSANDTRISWDFADASLTYITRIYNWEYKDTRISYYFAYFLPETYINGFAQRNINIFKYNHDINTDSDFTDAFDLAIPNANSEWRSALSPYIDEFLTTQYLYNADIEIFGGTFDELGYDSVIGAGVCGPISRSVYGFVIYENEISKVYRYYQMKIDIINYAENETEWGMSIVVTHEMGHALGYAGHSFNDIDAIMNASYSTDELQPDEIQNIYQIWEIFYE